MSIKFVSFMTLTETIKNGFLFTNDDCFDCEVLTISHNELKDDLGVDEIENLSINGNEQNESIDNGNTINTSNENLSDQTKNVDDDIDIVFLDIPSHQYKSPLPQLLENVSSTDIQQQSSQQNELQLDIDDDDFEDDDELPNNPEQFSNIL